MDGARRVNQNACNEVFWLFDFTAVVFVAFLSGEGFFLESEDGFVYNSGDSGNTGIGYPGDYR